MSDLPRTVRIFISSPGDVKDERERACGMIHRLRRRYAKRLDLQTLLWEDFCLSAAQSFQRGIDQVIESILADNGLHIAIFILWSRLGSPTEPLEVDAGLRAYRSGTEREWDLMHRARSRCQRDGSPPRPEILVYTRKDEPAFDERLRGMSTRDKDDLVQQKKLVEQFIHEQFRDTESGVNLRAHQTFDQPTTFAHRLRTHLTSLLDAMAGGNQGEPAWSIDDHGPPFRGLEVFEFHHAPIFFGREDEIVAIRARLREQACRGCAFVLISGPSGSGKSSLARAGVLPDVCQDELDADLHRWRWLAVKPSQLGEDLTRGLVESLCLSSHALPELREWAAELAELDPRESSSLQDWKTLFCTRVRDALKKAGANGGTTRLIVLLDQLEELFSDTAIASIHRERLFETLEMLARSGFVWVLATVRSDFYQHCQTLPSLMRMKEGAGWFDLLPPPPDALSRVITEPAFQAGLRFERRDDLCLSDTILREATEHKELLPLVEHLLLELCERRSEDGTLTFAEFQRLGGVEGALRQRCEETFAGLSPAVQAALEAVLAGLVTLSGDGQETFVRRTVPLATFAGDERALINAMVNARLLTTALGADNSSVISVAHEALLRVWPRAVQLIESKRQHLRLRARVEQSQQNWEHRGRIDALLLPSGPPLDEARQLLLEAPQLVYASVRHYIENSMHFHDQQSRLIRTEILVHSLLTAEPSQLPELLRQLDVNPDLAATLLAPQLSGNPQTLAEKRARLHARLAVVSSDRSLVEPLVEELLTARVPYIMPIRWRLRSHAGQLRHEFERVFRDKSLETQRRFRAAVALADLAGDDEPLADDDRAAHDRTAHAVRVDERPENPPLLAPTFWSEPDIRYVAGQLVSSNAEFQPLLRDALRPLAWRLLPELERIFADGQASEAQRLGAANALADYAASDTPRLAELLTLATTEQFDVLYPLVAAAATPATVELLARIAATPPDDDLGSRPRILFGQRRAGAAVTLLRLGERETVMPVFQVTDDPEGLTQFIFRCRSRGVGAEALLDCLRLASSERHRFPEDARYALLLALGEYRREEVSELLRDQWLRTLADWYASDPSSSVHGAAGWLLRQWGEAEAVRKVDQTAIAYSPHREWFTLAISVQPTGSSGSSEPKTFYYTFIVFPPGTFQIGSIADEPERDKDEIRHTVTLTRSFALLDRQITFEELIVFSEQYAGFMADREAQLTDVGFGPDWYDAVGFCRWLSTQAGFAESDQPYGEANPSLPADRPIDARRPGFRLPLEAEWEVATRAGARTAYGFGGDEGVLTRFGWFLSNSGRRVHPPKQLCPGRRGLFDLHGNLFDWVHDWYARYDAEALVNPSGPQGGSDRVVRGGSWSSDAADCRTAYRPWNDPANRGIVLGFRLALSFVGVPAEPGQVKQT